MYRLMIADDSETTRKIVGLTFTEPDFEVVSMVDGNEVLSSLKASPVDLLLVDVDLPGIDGYQLCEAMGHDPDLARIPVVLMGSIRCPVDQDRLKHLDRVAKIDKPFESRSLEVLVRDLLGNASWSKSASPVRDRVGLSSLSDMVISSICDDTIDNPLLLDGLDLDDLQSFTRSLSRKYLGEEDRETAEPSPLLSESAYERVAELVMERLSVTLKEMIPQAAEEVLGKNRSPGAD